MLWHEGEDCPSVDSMQIVDPNNSKEAAKYKVVTACKGRKERGLNPRRKFQYQS